MAENVGVFIGAAIGGLISYALGYRRGKEVAAELIHQFCGTPKGEIDRALGWWKP